MADDRVRSSDRRWLAVALVASAVAVAGAAAFRLAETSADGGDLGGRLFAVLVAAALADAAFLSRHRSGGVAWFAAVISVGIAAFEIARALRDVGAVADLGSTTAGVATTVAAFIAASGVALLDAARPRRRAAAPLDRVLIGVVGFVVTAVVAAGAWTVLAAMGPRLAAAATDGDALAPIRITGRLAVVAVGLGLAVGALRDLQPGLARGWARWRAGSGEVGGGSLARHLADELLPWRAAARAQAREDERASLAADLHALVLPDLRRAAAASASSGSSNPAAAGVQRALDDVERLMHGRQSIVLEEFGLVAALEWLAERTEQRGGLSVDLELVGDGTDRRDAIRRDIARSAFRIALLALDNVERHAHATRASIGLRVEPALVAISIEDDGQSTATWSTTGGRGLADMRAEAAATGGTLRVATQPTRIEATWHPR